MNVQAIEAWLSQEFAAPNLRFEVSRRDRILFVFVTAPHLQHPESFAALVYAAIAPLSLPTLTELRVLDGTDQPQRERWQRSFPLTSSGTPTTPVPQPGIPQPAPSLPPPIASRPRPQAQPVPSGPPSISPRLPPEKRAALMSRPSRQRRRWASLALWLALGLALLLALGAALTQGRSSPSVQARTGDPVTALAPLLSGDQVAALNPPPFRMLPSSLDLRLAFFGDVFWGRYINDWSAQSPLGTAYPFSQFDSIGKREGEYWIGNLECPVTTVQTSSAQQEARLKFNCVPDYLPEAVQWFDAVSLANNHTDNWNEYDGFAVTKGFLEAHNLQYFGHYNNQHDETCKVLAIPSQHQGHTYRLPVALCGYHGVFRKITPEEISLISNYARYMPVVAMPHTGAEYVTKPGSIKVETYRAMVEAGADMVIGGHPHAVQSTAVHQGKLIVYSQGNFLFDQQRGILRTTHLGLRAQISIDDPAYIRTATTLPDHCFNTYALCPDIQASLPKPIYRIHYEPFYTANPERVPRAAYPAEVTYIQRVSQIEDTLAQLP